MKRRRFRLSTKGGLTFVELIIALFVFVVAGAGVFISYLFSSQLIDDATNRMIAVEDLGDIMERVQATSFDELLTSFPDGEIDGGDEDYASLVGGYTLESQQIVVTYPSQTSGRVELLITLSWEYRGRSFSHSLSTVRTSG